MLKRNFLIWYAFLENPIDQPVPGNFPSKIPGTGWSMEIQVSTYLKNLLRHILTQLYLWFLKNQEILD